MKGKIANTGFLWIQRGTQWVQQVCAKKSTACWDRCPLFGEPWESNQEHTAIMLCEGRRLIFDEFKDERGKP